MNIRNLALTVFAATNFVGSVDNPLPPAYQSVTGSQGGLIQLLTNIVRLMFVAGGIFAFFNIITAGFEFMNAGGDSKKIEDAWKRIWQSLVGLVLIVGSFAAAAFFGYVIFGDAGFILSPKIYGPGK